MRECADAVPLQSTADEAGVIPADVRLLRHQPVVGGKRLVDVWRTDPTLFNSFQSVQVAGKRSQLARRFWAVFIGMWDGRTMFSGLHEVGAPTLIEADEVSAITGTVDPAGTCDRYPLSTSTLLQAYEGRLYIDWGGGPSGKRAWVQKAEAQDKLITELHLDAAERPFPGLMALALPLSEIAAAPAAWQTTLAESRGVYLLTCPRDGSQYVGSATGEGGFWQRWTDYAANGHGGNVALLDRERSDFTASILEVAGSATTGDQILAAEAAWKRKLMTGQHGLTRN